MTPTAIKLHRLSQTLEVAFGDLSFSLPAEYLRVHSPSAEVRGHGPGQAVLPYGKRDVAIIDVLAQGNYAIKLRFSDGHDSGIYTWAYLYELGHHHLIYWQTYLDKLHAAGKTRDAEVSVVRLVGAAPAKDA